jgi:transcriptional regulator with XRE-family HTH domain
MTKTKPKSTPTKADPFAIRRGQLIRMQRVAKDLTIKQFAALTGLSDRTIRRVESGEESRGDTLPLIAEKLGMDYRVLAEPEPALTSSPPASKSVKVTIAVEVPFELLERLGQVEKFVENLRVFIKATGPFSNPVVDQGSTLITVDMPIADAQRLAEYFDAGLLRQLWINSITIPDANAVHAQRVKSLRKLSRGMVGIDDEATLFAKEAAIRLAARLTYMGECLPKFALKNAEEILAANNNVIPKEYENFPVEDEEDYSKPRRKLGFFTHLSDSGRKAKPMRRRFGIKGRKSSGPKT